MRDSHDILVDLPPPAADARIAYGPGPLQFGDLRLPQGDGPWPLAVVLHGGYWRATYNLIHAGHLCGALTKVGIATWNVEYRRVGDVDGGWPGSGEDVSRAVGFLRELPLETTSAILVGHSAGGHLALWVAKHSGLPVVALAPVSDLRESWRRQDGCGAAASFLGGSPEEVPEHYAAASPRELLPLGATQIVVHGTADGSVPYEMSKAYVEAAGEEAELVTLDATGHFELIDPQSAAWPTVEAAIHRLLSAPARELRVHQR